MHSSRMPQEANTGTCLRHRLVRLKLASVEHALDLTILSRISPPEAISTVEHDNTAMLALTKCSVCGYGRPCSDRSVLSLDLSEHFLG